MSLSEILSEKKAGILADWCELTVRSYPEDTARFLKRKKDQFQNPVGHAIDRGLESMLDWLCDDVPAKEVPPFLGEIVRMRAVQDIQPSHALTFVYLIKKVVREHLVDDIRQGRVLQELLAFESRVDRLALLAFDLYMKSRERVHETYKTSFNREAYRFMQRANELWGDYRDVPGVRGEGGDAASDAACSITEEEKGLAK